MLDNAGKLKPLSLSVTAWGQNGEVVENIRHSLTLSVPELQIATFKHDGTFVICGSGPSIEDHVEEIRADKEAGKPICAVKDCYDFLVSKGIIPDLYLSVEPRYKPIKTPQKESAYLLASRCNPRMFEDLKDYRVVMWHSWSREDELAVLDGKPCIGGGTTSGLRAVNVGYCLGFRKFKMYGMDSSLGKRGEKRINQDKLGNEVKTIEVSLENGEVYITNMAMAAQANEAQSIYDSMPDVSVDVIGSGLIPAIWKLRKERGLRI